MSAPVVVRGEFLEGSDIRVMARVLKHDGSVLTQADCTASGASYYVYDLNGSDPTAAIISATGLNPNTFVTASLSTSGWTVDSIGYNFLWVLQNSSVFQAPYAATGGHRYRAEVRIATTSFGVVVVVAELACKPTFSS